MLLIKNRQVKMLSNGLLPLTTKPLCVQTRDCRTNNLNMTEFEDILHMCAQGVLCNHLIKQACTTMRI